MSEYNLKKRLSLSQIIDQPPSIDDWLIDDETSRHIPNALARAIERRLSRGEVRSQGILKSQVEEVGKQLSRKAIAVNLNESIQRRPSAEALQEAGILTARVERGIVKTESEVAIDQMESGELSTGRRFQVDASDQLLSSWSARTESETELDQMEKGNLEASDALLQGPAIHVQEAPKEETQNLSVDVRSRGNSLNQW